MSVEQVTPTPQPQSLPPQIYAQAGMVVDRMFQNVGLALINSQARELAIGTVGLAIVSAFNAGAQFQQKINAVPPAP